MSPVRSMDQALEKYILKKIVEDGWALQVNGTEINWKLKILYANMLLKIGLIYFKEDILIRTLYKIPTKIKIFLRFQNTIEWF